MNHETVIRTTGTGAERRCDVEARHLRYLGTGPPPGALRQGLTPANTFLGGIRSLSENGAHGYLRVDPRRRIGLLVLASRPARVAGVGSRGRRPRSALRR